MDKVRSLIDNQNGNTLAEALDRLLESATGSGSQSDDLFGAEVRVATAYFNPMGFARIADRLAIVPRVRLLLGAEVKLGAPVDRRALGETREDFERRQITSRLRSLQGGLRWERDRFPFTPANAAALQKLITALRAGNLEVRRYERAFLHAKAYIVASGFSSDRQTGIIVGSSNLTGGGLVRNLELNLSRDDSMTFDRASDWFDGLWDHAEPYDLAQLYEDVLEPVAPWDVFIRVLLQIYGKEVEEDAKIDEGLPLTNFQKHGVARALRLINETGGAIVADEVGLGKTFIAGEILKLYINRRQRALLICPAALRDSTWKTFLNDYQLFAECLSFEQLAADRQLQDKQRPNANASHIQRRLDEYQLVIVDEAHNYRNPNTPTRAAALRALLFGTRRDLLLLTATPVNNSLWDLYHLLRFFLRQDSHLADRGILSIRARFESAMRRDPASLSPDLLYPVIDATTVKRTRQFVRKHYSGDTIPGPDGEEREIVFPKPVAHRVSYNLDNRMPGFFDLIEESLDPDGSEALTFVRYSPDRFLLSGAEPDDAANSDSLVGLLRSGLLKRFESSTRAFFKTVDKMADEHQAFLDALALGRVVTTAFMQEIAADDDTDIWELLGKTQHSRDANLYDVARLRSAVERDRDHLLDLATRARSITPDRDPKLRALADKLEEISKQASDEATSNRDEQQKRKVLIFSLYTDTVEWVLEFLRTEIPKNRWLQPYENRVVATSGSRDFSSVTRRHAVLGFAPISMQAPSGADTDLYDILVSTDVLAEGVNLQQCRTIINFDLPWNPMRLVQRHGRIDRIGSPHTHVYLATIFPVDRLDRLLNLEERIIGKLAMAAASVGVAAPIKGAAQGSQVFTESREEIEKLLKNDPSLFELGGTPSGAQSGEEYRQTLRKALQQSPERVRSLPWKIGSGMRRGGRRGYLFCAVVGSESDMERTYLRFVPADGEWKPEVDPDAIESELGTCLRLLECEEPTPVDCPDQMLAGAFESWSIAQRHVWRDWMRETDPANTQPPVRPLNHRVARFIRQNCQFGSSDGRVKRALDILESPWPRREESMLREWFEGDDEDGVARANRLIDSILESGLVPSEPPPLLPPIHQDDVELVCWMGIHPANGGESD